jgi:hypothetical protein
MANILNPEFDKVQSTYRASTEDVLYQLQEIKNAVSGGGGDSATATNQEEQIVLATALNSAVATSAKQDTTNALITSLNSAVSTSAKQDTTNALITALNSAVATATKQIEQINILNGISNYLYRTYVSLSRTQMLNDFGGTYNISSGSLNIDMTRTIDDQLARIKYCTLLIIGDGTGQINVKGQFNGSTVERINIGMTDAETGAVILNPIDLSSRKLIKIDNTVMADFINILIVGTPTGNIFVRKGTNNN